MLRAVSDGRRRSFSEITNGGATTTDEAQNGSGGRRRSSAGGPSLGSWAAALERCILACSPNDGADYGGAQRLRELSRAAADELEVTPLFAVPFACCYGGGAAGGRAALLYMLRSLGSQLLDARAAAVLSSFTTLGPYALQTVDALAATKLQMQALMGGDGGGDDVDGDDEGDADEVLADLPSHCLHMAAGYASYAAEVLAASLPRHVGGDTWAALDDRGAPMPASACDTLREVHEYIAVHLRFVRAARLHTVDVLAAANAPLLTVVEVHVAQFAALVLAEATARAPLPSASAEPAAAGGNLSVAQLCVMRNGCTWRARTSTRLGASGARPSPRSGGCRARSCRRRARRSRRRRSDWATTW